MSVNLCSISGAKNGGKDLVGTIMQLIERWYDTSTGTSFRKEYPNGVVEFVGHHLRLDKRSSLHLTSKWQNKKFGYKLKQIASILLGVPVEKFEDREFKESYLDDYQMTVRQFLQICGTNAMRDVISENIWVNGLFSDYKPNGAWNNYSQGLNSSNPDYLVKKYPHWLISDTRFFSELQAVKDRGGITVKIDSDERLEIQNIAKAERLAMIRLTNENDDCFYEDGEGQYHLKNNTYQAKFTKYYNEEFNKLKDTHESETAWRNWEFDYVIDNNKDIPHLIKEVEKFYKHYNL